MELIVLAGTWYDTGLNACGGTDVDSDFIVAVNETLFTCFPGANPNNPNTNPICGKKITAHCKYRHHV